MNISTRILITIILIYIPSKSIGQLSGPSFSYGKSYKEALHESNSLVSMNAFNFEYHQYLLRFWSASIHYQHNSGTFNDIIHLDNSFKINSFDS